MRFEKTNKNFSEPIFEKESGKKKKRTATTGIRFTMFRHACSPETARPKEFHPYLMWVGS
jgi:hypothetical protein